MWGLYEVLGGAVFVIAATLIFCAVLEIKLKERKAMDQRKVN